MIQPVATARVRWLTASEGGRRSPPPGPIYAATAHFADETYQFSVALRAIAAEESTLGEKASVDLSLLAPENLPEIVARMVPNTRLYIMEGAKTVAECELLSIRMADSGAVFH